MNLMVSRLQNFEVSVTKNLKKLLNWKICILYNYLQTLL